MSTPIFDAYMADLEEKQTIIQNALTDIRQCQKDMGMKSRPILFSTPMVQALLNGTKTQTRRIIKDSFNGCWTGANNTIQAGGHPCPNDPIVIHPGEVIKSGDWLEEETPDLIAENTVVEAWFFCSTMDNVARCPYGKIGDTLWVRETFYAYGHWTKTTDLSSGKIQWHFNDLTEDQGLSYRYLDDVPDKVGRRLVPHLGWHKRPSLFMPKAASRITLQITDIRAERLLSISEEDAAAEGVEVVSRPTAPFKIYRNYTPENREIFGRFDTQMSATESYFTLWDKINGKDAHLVNPWVWAITFKVVKP